MSMEKVKRPYSNKKKSRLPITNKSKYNNNKHNIVVFYKIKKYSEIQLTKKINLNNRKIKNHPPSPSLHELIM